MPAPGVSTGLVRPGPLVQSGNFVAYPNDLQSVRVAAVDRVFRDVATGDDYFGPLLIAATAPQRSSHVKVFTDDFSLLDELFPYHPDFHGGVFVAGSVDRAPEPIEE